MHLFSKLLTLSFAVSNNSKIQNAEEQQQYQLSWPELGQILLDVQAQGIPDERIMNTRFPSLPLSRLRVGPSSVGGGGQKEEEGEDNNDDEQDSSTHGAGRGVFATEDCQEGDLLTCYPGDILLHPTNGFTPPPTKEMGITSDDQLQDLMSRYCIGMTEEYAIMGLPHMDDDMAYAGHLINDGVGKPPQKEDEIEAYLEESQAKANAQLIPLENLHMVAIATRDIKKDEEIHIFYGPIYWMEHASTWKGETLEP